MDLTAAQQRMLADVRASGSRVYNGRARRTIEALETAGLVTVDWDMDLTAGAGGLPAGTRWRITVTARRGERTDGRTEDHA